MLVIASPSQPSLKRSLQDVLELAKKTVSENKLIVVINDFDSTVSQQPEISDNPFDTKLNLSSAKALSEMEEKGVAIGIVSNRSGGQIAKRYKDAGIKNPFIVGTYGMELFQNESIIDERFVLYKNPITDIFTKTKQVLLDAILLPHLNTLFVETIIPTPNGPVYLENKGINQDFPQGISQVYNFNKISPEIRKDYVTHMANTFTQNLYTYEGFSSELEKLWGISELGNIKSGDYSWSIEPLVKEGKSYGITKLLKAVDDLRGLDKPIGLVIYGGDENADAQAMQGARDLASMSSGDQILSVVGIWVNPGSDKADVKEASNLEVKGVSQYANFLQKLADSI